MVQSTTETQKQTTYGYELNSTTSEVTDFLSSFTQVIRSGDLDAIMSYYSDELVAYDLMPPLEYDGKKQYRDNWEKYFTSIFKFPVNYSYEKQQVTRSGDIAFANALIHMSGVANDGKKMELWMRNTVCLKKFNDVWMITHEHNSFPVDDKMQGLTNLRPEVH